MAETATYLNLYKMYSYMVRRSRLLKGGKLHSGRMIKVSGFFDSGEKFHVVNLKMDKPYVGLAVHTHSDANDIRDALSTLGFDVLRFEEFIKGEGNIPVVAVKTKDFDEAFKILSRNFTFYGVYDVADTADAKRKAAKYTKALLKG
jgi:hypothetical protein